MITFLAPDEKILATAQTALAQSHADIRIEQGLLSAGVEKARELINGGTEIIIGPPFAFTADNIAEWKTVY